jgi:hypothetical protein
LWRTRCWICEWTWVRGRMDICDSFLTRILFVCRCAVWGAACGVWGRIGEAWRVPETFLCSLWIQLQWILHVLGLPGSREGAGVALIR